MVQRRVRPRLSQGSGERIHARRFRIVDGQEERAMRRSMVSSTRRCPQTPEWNKQREGSVAGRSGPMRDAMTHTPGSPGSIGGSTRSSRRRPSRRGPRPGHRSSQLRYSASPTRPLETEHHGWKVPGIAHPVGQGWSARGRGVATRIGGYRRGARGAVQRDALSEKLAQAAGLRRAAVCWLDRVGKARLDRISPGAALRQTIAGDVLVGGEPDAVHVFHVPDQIGEQGDSRPVPDDVRGMAQVARPRPPLRRTPP